MKNPPSTPLIFAIAIAAAVLTAMITRWVEAFARRNAMMDIPNARSSHTVPTPRGGGVAIALVVLLGTIIESMAGQVSGRFATALVGGGLLVGLVGWYDDRRGLSARVRATFHVIAACWAEIWLGGLPQITFANIKIDLGPFGGVLAVVLIVWFINLYNFMDGIDGLAGAEAASVAGIMAALLFRAGESGVAMTSLVVSVAAIGFLTRNWAPARIFMGDVGSGFLGYVFAVIALASQASGAMSLVVSVLLLGVFFFDSTVTLMRRMKRGERWYAAHKLHAYQRAVQAGQSHATVSATAVAINLMLGLFFWIAPTTVYALAVACVLAVTVITCLYLVTERLKPMFTCSQQEN